ALMQCFVSLLARADDDRPSDGLSIVRTIAELHGGHATATNRPTGGADVWISLPREPVANYPTGIFTRKRPPASLARQSISAPNASSVRSSCPGRAAITSRDLR